MHVTQNNKSSADKFRMNTVLVCQCSSNLNLWRFCFKQMEVIKWMNRTLGQMTFFGSWHKEWQQGSASFQTPQRSGLWGSRPNKQSQCYQIPGRPFDSQRYKMLLCSPYISCWESECLRHYCRRSELWPCLELTEKENEKVESFHVWKVQLVFVTTGWSGKNNCIA